MLKRNLTIIMLLLAVVLALGACGVVSANSPSSAPAQNGTTVPPTAAAPASGSTSSAPAVGPTAAAPSASALPATGSLADVQGALEQIYANVNPSVVTISVTGSALSGGSNNQGSPFGGLPQGHPQVPQGALGSGFVWDTSGHIVTNNHVIDGASTIEVTFADGTIVSGKVVGADPNSDLAVIQVSVPASELHPVQLADSSQLKVGQFAIAIGNPFGEQNTMTTGIISALGRALPVNNSAAAGPTYQIPDVIQTDAPINPGNSGGVLLNDQGQVVGVTSAIESPVQASSGIGFAIPSAIVQKVVPALIQSGHYDHPYLGISGTDLTPDLAKAMNLDASQRGALVGDVTPGGPAAKAGLKPSTQQTTIQGQSVNVGGDVITAFDGHPVKTFDDLVASLERYGQIGQNATLTVLRGGQTQSVTVTVGARPAAQPAAQTTPAATAGVTLGNRGLDLTPAIAQAMNLSSNQTGVLVEQVQPGSPAERAGLQASSKTATINGSTVQIGGDVITALNGSPIATVSQLQRALQQQQPGSQVTLTILRGGQQQSVQVTLTPASNTTP